MGSHSEARLGRASCAGPGAVTAPAPQGGQGHKSCFSASSPEWLPGGLQAEELTHVQFRRHEWRQRADPPPSRGWGQLSSPPSGELPTAPPQPGATAATSRPTVRGAAAASLRPPPPTPASPRCPRSSSLGGKPLCLRNQNSFCLPESTTLTGTPLDLRRPLCTFEKSDYGQENEIRACWVFVYSFKQSGLSHIIYWAYAQ